MQACTLCELASDGHALPRLYADAWLVVRLDLGREGARLWIVPRSHSTSLDAGLEQHAQRISRRARQSLGMAGMDFGGAEPELLGTSSELLAEGHAHLRLAPATGRGDAVTRTLVEHA